ncbi:MAG TPA: aminotransferase class I/II-fold pyridoxal phosphate-dependent enzyme, partial [Solirubrobacteraceae bacterium]|nr:aminotransferase class I/II-fold pyridoxal phosphate-dependent enzyme [Solirubrobacteraceae bacterium]
MDAELARTLDELEHKLLELERTVGAMARPDDPSAALAPGAPQPSAPSQLPPLDGSPVSGDATSRAPSTAGRIVDERIEPPQAVPVAPEQAASPARAPGPPDRAGGGAPRAAARAAARTGPAAPAPPPPPPPRAPANAEALLRFRDRLERMARDLTHDYDELLGRLSYAAVSATSGPPISFARGVPSLDIIDVEGLRDAALRAFDSDPAGITAYGTSVGYPRLRSWIADHHGVDPERVLVTNGSLQADAFLFDHLVHPGDEVIVESPTYDRTLLSLRHRGAQLHAVELEPDGIDTDALRRLLDGGAAPTLAHIIPNFQNPAGYTLSLEKRRRLLELAAEHSFIVLEDDPYAELRFSGEPVPTMLSLDPANVVYASSFTKTVCPGVRVGYLVGPEELIAGIARRATNTYISPGMVSESIVYEFCVSGAIERSIETVRRALAERASALASALASELPEAEFVAPQGGYFMWVTLPEGSDVAALAGAAKERGVVFVKGTDFMLEGGENALRLAYSGV